MQIENILPLGSPIGTFVIKRKLPSLNEVIRTNRSNKFMGAKYKKDIQEAIGWDIKQAITVGTLKPIKEPCEILIFWNEATKRRDVDNIQSSQKFILDELQNQGILVNDNRKYIKNVFHIVQDSKEDYIRVFLLKPVERGQ